MFDIIIFDLGKVIFDFDFLKFTKSYQKQTNLKLDNPNELLSKYMYLAQDYETGKLSSFDFYKKLANETGYGGSFNEFSIIWCEIFTPISKTIEIIASLAKNYQLALLSNTNDLHFNYLKERYPRVFMLFDKFFLSYEMNLCKPSDKIYQKVIEKLNIEPSKIFFTDDMQENVDSAIKNRISGYRFTTGTDLIKHLQEKGIKI